MGEYKNDDQQGKDYSHKDLMHEGEIHKGQENITKHMNKRKSARIMPHESESGSC